MNVQIGTEAAQFPEKEYINGISLQCMQLLDLFFSSGVADLDLDSARARIFFIRSGSSSEVAG
jgi:hypothetical protein